MAQLKPPSIQLNHSSHIANPIIYRYKCTGTAVIFMYCIRIFQNSRVSSFRTSANHRQQGS